MNDAIQLNSAEVEQLGLTAAAEGDSVTLTCQVTATDNSGLTLVPQSGEVEESGGEGEGDDSGTGTSSDSGGEDDSDESGEGTPPSKNPAVAALLIARKK